jgi:hypothetical protein
MFHFEVEATIATPRRSLKHPPFRSRHCPRANFVWFYLIIST